MIKFPSKPFSLPGFPLIERALNHFRTAIEGFVRDVNSKPILHGTHILNQSITSSYTTHYHKLGRMPQGWIITSSTGRVAIAESISLRNTETVTLRGNGNSTVSIWFF